MNITMIGAGYVGLVSGICFSDFGHQVTCMDADKEKIVKLKAGKIPIFEPGLATLMESNIKAGRLTFTTDLQTSVAKADAVFIAVGTPSRRGDGHADLSYVIAAAEEIGKALEGYTVVVIKSTVPIGTNRKIAAIIKAVNPEAQFDISSNPEFLREGAAIDDFMRPDRVIVGIETERAKQLMGAIYRPLYLRDLPIVYTDLESAEMIKYAANAFLATKISFINEIAALCENVGADIKSVSKGMGLDKRIGNKFLHAGPGYGGSCFPKDTLALARIGQEHNAAQQIVETVIRVNEKVKTRMISKIIDSCGGSVQGKVLTILGVTFKPNTDDMRHSPSLSIIPALINKGATIRVVDPQGYREGKALLPPSIAWVKNAYSAAKNAEAIIILTEWNEFRALNLSKLAQSMTTPTMIDLRNIYNREDALAAGFICYESIGNKYANSCKT